MGSIIQFPPQLRMVPPLSVEEIAAADQRIRIQELLRRINNLMKEIQHAVSQHD